MEPGRPPIRTEGTETVHSFGPFWILADYKGTFADGPFKGLLTLGYNSRTKKFVGSWISSLSGNILNYEGTLDATGNTLTLEAEGYCHTAPDRLSKFRQVIELWDKDHRRFTSSMQGEDGKYVMRMSINYTRV